MRYCFDIDGTICNTPCNPDGHGMRYEESTPFPDMVDKINQLYDDGLHYSHDCRGRGSGKDWTELTTKQVQDWGLKFHEIEPMFHKPNADIFVDDKGINVEEWKRLNMGKRGIVNECLILSTLVMSGCSKSSCGTLYSPDCSTPRGPIVLLVL